MVQLKSVLPAVTVLLASTAQAVIPLVAKGANFVNSVSNARFQILGAAYQPGGSSGFNPGSGVDPLSDGTICLRDAILLQRLGVNMIRVYNVDGTIDHTQCMSIFNAAGIYVLLDVNSPLPNGSLDRTAPYNSYDPDYMTRVFQVVEGFKNFNNTIGFFAGNEVINEDSVPSVPSYIRAVTRDIKDYISKHAPRTIPVGYSAADVRPLLEDTYNYLSCSLANSTSSKTDFFGLNSYSWCGNASFTTAGYDVLVSMFSNATVPVFFSEYGCNKVEPRTFSEVQAIYSTPFDSVFSGGAVYEYSEEPSDYGLVTINSADSVTLKVDYQNLMTEYNQINLQALTAANSSATGQTAPTCSSSLITSNLTDSFDIPARLSSIQSLIDSGVGNSSYPTGFASVTATAMPAQITGVNGAAVSGLSLRVLGHDQSNLPGNNTAGNGGTSGSGSGSGGSSSSSSHNAGPTPFVNKIALGAVALGLVAQL